MLVHVSAATQNPQYTALFAAQFLQERGYYIAVKVIIYSNFLLMFPYLQYNYTIILALSCKQQ
jgi:hypothetical protein